LERQGIRLVAGIFRLEALKRALNRVEELRTAGYSTCRGYIQAWSLEKSLEWPRNDRVYDL